MIDARNVRRVQITRGTNRAASARSAAAPKKKNAEPPPAADPTPPPGGAPPGAGTERLEVTRGRRAAANPSLGPAGPSFATDCEGLPNRKPAVAGAIGQSQGGAGAAVTGDENTEPRGCVSVTGAIAIGSLLVTGANVSVAGAMSVEMPVVARATV